MHRIRHSYPKIMTATTAVTDIATTAATPPAKDKKDWMTEEERACARRLDIPAPTISRIKKSLDEVAKGEGKPKETGTVHQELWWASAAIGATASLCEISKAKFLADTKDLGPTEKNEEALRKQMAAALNECIKAAGGLNEWAVARVGNKPIHFSAKLSNSSATGSVRIAGDRRVDPRSFPYLFSATVQHAGIPLSYDLPQIDKDASPLVKEVNRWIDRDVRLSKKDNNQADEGGRDEEPGRPVATGLECLPEEEVGSIVEAIKAMPEDAYYPPALDARLATIRLPLKRGDDWDYVALTPLSATGMMSRITRALSGKKSFARQVTVRYGGDKPQNVTVAGQPSSFLFSAPAPIEPEARLLRSLEYGNPFSIRLEREFLNVWAEKLNGNPDWFGKNTDKGRELTLTATPLGKMIRGVLDDVQDAMKACADALEGGVEPMPRKDGVKPLECAILAGRLDDDGRDDLIDRIVAGILGVANDGYAAINVTSELTDQLRQITGDIIDHYFGN